MISGVGTDIISITYIEKMYRKHGDAFAKRYLSSAELIEYWKRPRKHEYLAGRFAAKEAFFKATNRHFSPKSISILNDCAGNPCIIFQNHIQQRSKFLISLSHHGEYAIAIVIVEEA